jgi:tight adherence protein B
VTPAIATFVVVLLVFLGVQWALLVRPERRARARLLARLAVAGPTRSAGTRSLKAARPLSTGPGVDRAPSRGRRLTAPAQRLIDQSAARITLAMLIASCGLAALVALLVVLYLTGQLLLALPAAALSAWVPVALLRWKRSRRLRAFEEQFPEALDLLARSLKAGHAFTAGVAMVADEMPAPVGPEFRVLHDQQTYGMPMPHALRAFAERVPLVDAQFFVTAVLIQRESGGNLAETLENLASVIRDRFRVKRQVRVISAHGRLTGVVLMGVPPALAMALFVVSPDHWTTLVSDPLGVRLVLLALALQAVGALAIRRLVRVEY